jgi:hypothetical protein
MKNRNTIEDELDAIRVDLYEKTKGMTSAEANAYIREQTAPVNEKYGIKPVARASGNTPKTASYNV